MAEEEKISWADRNNVVRIFKLNSKKQGWMHLVIGENKITGRKFLRLKKYRNWFSIPDGAYLASMQRMLKMGAEELGWAQELDSEITIKEVTGKEAKQIGSEALRALPDEYLTLIEEHPEVIDELISLDLDKLTSKKIASLVKILGETIIKSGNRFTNALEEALGKLKDKDANALQGLSDLMGDLSLTQITALASIVNSRLQVIESFEKMIHDEGTYEINGENSIHRLLEKSMWLVNDDYWIVQANRSLRTFIGDEIEAKDPKNAKKRPDFACVNYQRKLIIIEIKKPSLTLGKDELDQAELYQLLVRRYKGQDYKSVEVYLVGNKISDDAREIAELRKNLSILTYQDILEGARNRYQEYLKIVETNEV